MRKILIVEDELSIAELERDYLELSGFEVILETDGEKGPERREPFGIPDPAADAGFDFDGEKPRLPVRHVRRGLRGVLLHASGFLHAGKSDALDRRNPAPRRYFV